MRLRYRMYMYKCMRIDLGSRLRTNCAQPAAVGGGEPGLPLSHLSEWLAAGLDGDACLIRSLPAARGAFHASEIARADDAQGHHLL